MSGKYIKTVGFSGVTQLLPMTAPVSISLKDTEIRIPILVSEHTPVNLLGRDAICKLKMQIWCTPDGIYVDDKAIRQMNVSTLQQTQEPCANIYWLGELKEDVEKTISKWGRYMREQLCEPSLPKTEFHCTMKYDENKDSELEKRWLENTKGLKITMMSQYIVVRPEGAALQVDREKFIDEWFEVPNSVPHVTLCESKNCVSKDLGPMMQKAEKCKWEATENHLIFQSADKVYLKILCATPMLGVPRMVINTNIDPKVNEHQTKQTELLKEMEKQVPMELWSQHDTDVRLVKSANPVRIALRSGAKVPKNMQYPLKPEAEKGIKKTIEGLVKAGVLIESASYCNTPILPVAKADKSKWRLVHDLRAVNEVVEDWPAEVPNPHTLLTNVPSAANYFTVIDLCSAFFSVPLAEESQPLFAFTYQGKQNTLKMKYCLQKQNRTIRERLILVLVLIYLMQRLPKIRGNPQGPLNQDPQLMSSPDINLRNSSHLIQTPLLIYSINVTDQTPGIYANIHVRKRSAGWTYDDENDTLIYDMESYLQKEGLLDAAHHNDWFKWAEYTAKEAGMFSCVLCSPSPLKKLVVVPNPYDYMHCGRFYSQYCNNMTRKVYPYCPAECLTMLGNKNFHRFYRQQGWGDECKRMDIRIEATKRETPVAYVIDRTLEFECFNKSEGKHDMGKFKGNCVIIWHLDQNMYYDSRVLKSFSLIYATATISTNMSIIQIKDNCPKATISFPLIRTMEDQLEAVADYYWVCGGKRLRATLPKDWKGMCTRVRMVQEITLIEGDLDEVKQPQPKRRRAKRAYEKDPNVSLDIIGQPRGIPEEYKARNEIKSGFESIWIWITPNKNLEWINYIYYNQQRFINYTDDALDALGKQLGPTSKMTWQNRQALNWLLAEKGGVCVMFGSDCCTYIPNNTAPDGSFTKAMGKLRNLREEVTKNAGADMHTWDWFNSLFGSWGQWLTKVGIIIGIVVVMFLLLFCCIVPFIRSMLASAAAKQMINVSVRPTGIDVG